MDGTILQVMEKHFSHVKFDTKLAQEIYRYQVGYVNLNREHLEFFGSNLLGVHVIRFKTNYVEKLYNDILNIDGAELRRELHSLKIIDPSHKVASDTFNHVIMFMIHKFLTSPLLMSTRRERAALDCALVFFYRTISAIQNSYFPYPTDPKIAQAAYANLSRKHLIKQLGNWNKLMVYRATALLDKKSPHKETFEKYTQDLSILYAITDSQGRIRDMVKNYKAEFYLAHGDGESIGTTSTTTSDVDGEKTIRDVIKGPEQHVARIRTLIMDERSFIQNDLLEVIRKINTNTSNRMIRQALKWMHDNYTDPNHTKSILDFISSVVTYSSFLIENNIAPNSYGDLPLILSSLKNLYVSTRSTDPELLRIRKMGDDIIKKANGRNSRSLDMATRTAVILYISLRVLVSD